MHPSARAILCLLLLASSLLGFGKNKVQYQSFTWNFYQAPNFTLYHHQDQGELPAITYSLMGDIYRTLAMRFQFTHRDPVPVIIYGDPNLFSQTNVITQILPEGVGGFTEYFKNRVVVPFNGSHEELVHVLHHEMVHAFINGIFFDQVGSRLISGGGPQLPLWLNEGLAEYLSSGWTVEADMFLMDYTINATVPLPGPGLSGYMAYKGGQSFLQYLASTHGDSTFTRFLRALKTSRSLDKTMKDVFGSSIEKLGKEWIKELRRLYWPEIGRRLDPAKTARAVTNHLESRDYVNLRPRISPDGKRIAFFSDKHEYTTILITDRRGRVLHTIEQSGYGGYFESFHPFRSGMCWSPDGALLAFVTTNGGRDQVRIVDVSAKKLVRTIDPPGLASIAGPDWSVDGSFLVFSGVKNGESNLFLYDLRNMAMRQLTSGPGYKADPRFLPGDTSVIYTFQDTSMTVGDPPRTVWGQSSSDLAVVSLADTSTRLLTATPWNEKQPCVAGEEGTVVFVSDRNGIDNMYLAVLDSMESSRPVTDYIGGCSSPDVTGDGKTAVFTLFNRQGWDVWLMEEPAEKRVADSLAPTKWVEFMLDSANAFFVAPPPGPRPDSADSARTAKAHDTKSDTTRVEGDDTVTVQPIGGLPAPQPYRLKFSPDMVTLGLGVSSFYGYAGGQWILTFSDIMGDHRITLAGDLQYQYSVESTAHIFGSYFYLKRRLDIGGGAYHYRDYSLASITNNSLYFFDVETGAFVTASYPFSRFSRLDAQLFGRTIRRSPRSSLPSFKPNTPDTYINTLMPSLAYSFDNILWGMTGPVNGTRAAATVDLLPPFPFVDEPFVSAQADLRNYMHLDKRFVWANRIFLGASEPLHDGASPRRFFLGGTENWLYTYSSSDINYRQYDDFSRNSFYSQIVVPFRGWRYFDLSGSRIAVVNSEFRFPFVREFSLAWPLPLAIRYVNGALFADVGNAWGPEDQIDGLPIPRVVNGGLGFGMRANLGIFVLRYDRGWPVSSSADRETGGPINYFSLGAEF